MIPIVIDQDNVIVIGEYFFKAAQKIEFKKVPTICIENVSEADIKTLRIAYDRVVNESDWNPEALKLEFEELQILIPEIDLSVTGFEVAEIDMILDLDVANDDNALNEIPSSEAITKRVQKGDLWILGDHKLFCGDALNSESYVQLLGADKAQICFTDAPYNVKIDGHVCGNGAVKHSEFEMASGEMSKSEFTQFLTKAHSNIAQSLDDGSIIFSCMDFSFSR